MALLRLKMDMPNEVFPSNCSERGQQRTSHRQISFVNEQKTSSTAAITFTVTASFSFQRIDRTFLTCGSLTSVKWISFLTPVLCGRNSSCSAMASSPSNLQWKKKKNHWLEWRLGKNTQMATKGATKLLW